MPYDEPDVTDPNVLVGVGLPAGAGAMEEMAYVFAEEFARMGLAEAAILDLFRNPFYGGAHQAYRALGPEAVRAIVHECVEVWGRAAGRIRETSADPPAPAADVRWLPRPAFLPAIPTAE